MPLNLVNRPALLQPINDKALAQFNGQGDQTGATMKAITVFAADLPPEYRAGLQNQRKMIEQIKDVGSLAYAQII